MEHIAPTHTSQKFTCPHCNTLSQHKWERSGFAENTTYKNGEGKEFMKFIDSFRCVTCGRFTIWVNTNLVYPTLSPPEPNKDMPKCVLDLYKPKRGSASFCLRTHVTKRPMAFLRFAFSGASKYLWHHNLV